MKKAILYAPYDVRIEELPDPVPGPNEAVVRWKVSSLCYTDVKLFIGVHKPTYPIGFGHDASGEVESIGSAVTKVKPGDRVVASSWAGCNACKMCIAGRTNLCIQRRDLFSGGKSAGWFGERAVFPDQNLRILPDTMDFDDGAVLEPLHTAIHTHDLIPYPEGGIVAVIGSGSMGWGQIQVAKNAFNCTVIAIDVLQNRLDMARTLGADHTINAATEDVPARMVEICGDFGPDAVMETAGTQAACDLAAEICGYGGALGLIGAIGNVPVRAIINREATVTGIRGGGRGTRERAIELVAAGKLSLKPAISHRFKLEEIPSVLQYIYDHRDQVNKVLLDH